MPNDKNKTSYSSFAYVFASRSSSNIEAKAFIIETINKENRFREKRSKNIIILGLNQSIDDKGCIDQLFTNLGSCKPLGFKRLKKKDINSSYPAPILCNFNNCSEVKEVLLSAKKSMKNMLGYEKVFLNEDLSISERLARSIVRKSRKTPKYSNTKNNASVLIDDVAQISSLDMNTVELGVTKKNTVKCTEKTNLKARDNMVKYSHIFYKDLNENDFSKLQIGSCLNDNIINYYLKLCCLNSENVFAFNTFTFNHWQENNLYSSTNYLNVNKQLINLESFDYFIIPIHQKLLFHWSIMIGDVKNKTLFYIDSLYNSNNNVFETVKKGLLSCNLNDSANWTSSVINVPKQDNNSDCGIYVCLISRVLVTHLKLDSISKLSLENFKSFRTHLINEFSSNKLIVLKELN